MHLSNLVPDSNGTTDFAVIAAREDANGFDGAWIANVYAVCANTPGQLRQGVRHHPGELGEQVRHRQLSRGHPGPQRRCSVVAPAGSGRVDPSLVIDKVAIDPLLRSVTVRAVEDETGTAANWSVRALALCGP